MLLIAFFAMQAYPPRDTPQLRLIDLKRHIDFFGGRVLTDEKSGQNFLRSIFNPTHHFVLLCLDFLAVRIAFVRKRCGGKFGRSVLVDSLPKLIFGTSKYVKVLWSTVTTNMLCWHDEGENHAVNETRRLQHAREVYDCGSVLIEFIIYMKFDAHH